MKFSMQSLLLASTMLMPAVAAAQSAAPTPTSPSASPPVGSVATADPAAPVQDGTAAEAQTEVSAPGGGLEGDIVVVGRNIPNAVRATAEVVTVLSSADIARTGEGDIAGALTRVTGLSLVGNGFVYVRGLGDRYSSSLLNGSPLPSPEPLRRVVPLDIFPTNVIASALVQKSYSANYPGEFGGGVINLTTKAVPEETFFQIGGSLSADTVTTSELGYVYGGGRSDWTGFDDGTRRVPGAVRAAGETGRSVATGDVLGLNNANTTLLQRNRQLPANFSYEGSFGSSTDIGSVRLGVIAAAGLSNTWRTRSSRQQLTDDPAGGLLSDFQTVLTDNRAIVNGLLGVGLEFGEHKVRLTNLYIHDTLKQGRLSSGSTANIGTLAGGIDPFKVQNTNWFERELRDTQVAGEFKFGNLSFDARGAYARTKRDSPYERGFTYQYNEGLGRYANTLTGLSNATVAFSALSEKLVSGQANATWNVPFDRPFALSAGYAYTDTKRDSSRYTFRYQTQSNSALGDATSLLRPDFLVSDAVLTQQNIYLQNTSSDSGTAAYTASLRVHGAYAQLEGEIADGLRATTGVRFEKGDERVSPVGSARGTRINNSYWLPAVTVTWNFATDMQLRGHMSKTIARPQFRELAPQLYQDFESDRLFSGNPFLKDSQLYNGELRYEWYFARDQRVSLSGFYKRIDDPIEAVAFFPGGASVLQTGFANAPRAKLYGGEFELQKYFPLDGVGIDALSTYRIVAVANYTYTQSSIEAHDELLASPLSGNQLALTPANLLLRDGGALTGQSDHLVNLQLGVEDKASLSQLTLLFNYASDRVTNRGPVGGGGGVRLPDLIERPGVRFDIVARQGVKMFGGQFEIKAEARNLTGTGYQESQSFAENQKVFTNRYRLGRIFTLGASVTF